MADDERTATRAVRFAADGAALEGDLALPSDAGGVVLFAHGSGSSRFSARNRFVAAELNRAGLATLLIDLLTADEERVDERTGHLRFDIALLGDRLVAAIEWLRADQETRHLPVGLFGARRAAARPSSPRRGCRMRFARSSRAADGRTWRAMPSPPSARPRC